MKQYNEYFNIKNENFCLGGSVISILVLVFGLFAGWTLSVLGGGLGFVGFALMNIGRHIAVGAHTNFDQMKELIEELKKR